MAMPSPNPASPDPGRSSSAQAPSPQVSAELLQRCQAGEEQAFAELYADFVRVVHGIVLARVGADDAEDVTQEVFMKIHRKLADLREPEALPGWICSVARNHAIDHGRARQRRPDTLRLVEAQHPAAPESGQLLAEQLLAVIQTLPDAFRETLVLRLVEGLTGPEIASRCGMSHGSVRVNLSRGMALLRPLLQKEGWA